MATMRDDDLERATAQAMEDEERDTATEQAMDDESLASATGRALDDEEQPLPSEIWARNAQNRIFAANDAPLSGDAGGLGVVSGASGRTRPAPRTSIPLGSMSGPESEDRARVMREALEAIRGTRTTPAATPDASSVTAGGEDAPIGVSGGPRDNAPAGKVVLKRLGLADPTYRFPVEEAAHDTELRAGDRFASFGASAGGVGVKKGKGGITEGAGGRTPLGGLSPEPDGKDYSAITPDDPELADPFAQKTTGAGSVTAAKTTAPAKPSTLQSFFGDKEDNNPSWIARRGAEWNTIGSDRKPDYGVADEMDARRAKIAADRKAAMAAERQRGLDASLMRLRELQGRAAESTTEKNSRAPAVDPTTGARLAKLEAETNLAKKRAEAVERGPVGRAAGSGRTGGAKTTTGGHVTVTDSPGLFTENESDVAAELFLGGQKVSVGRDPRNIKMFYASIGKIAKRRGVDPAQAVMKAQADIGAYKNLNTTDAKLDFREGSIKGHFNVLLGADEKVGKLGIPAADKPLIWLKAHVGGDEESKNLINAMETSMSEYSSYMSQGGQNTDKMREKAERLIDEGLKHGQMKSAVQQMLREMDVMKRSLERAKEVVARRVGAGAKTMKVRALSGPYKDAVKELPIEQASVVLQKTDDSGNPTYEEASE